MNANPNQLALAVAEALPAPKPKQTRETQSRTMKNAWALRKEAAVRLGCRVHEVLMAVCMKMAYRLETFIQKTKYDLKIFEVKGCKYRQATGMIDGDTIAAKSKAHEVAGYEKATSQLDLVKFSIKTFFLETPIKKHRFVRKKPTRAVSPEGIDVELF